MNRFMRRLTAWIACFAILLVSLAPSISHAIATPSKASTGWGEICTSSGTKVVKATGDQTVKPISSAKHDLHYEDCPFCRTQNDTSGPPPTFLATPLLVVSPLLSPVLFYEAPRPLFVWASAQSRAPPASS